jgi:hypothetical protein
MRHHHWQRLTLCAVALAAACSDAPQTTAPQLRDIPASAGASRGLFTPTKYVAIGTSISMGWMSNGVYSGSQLQSWPALLSFGSLRPISLPLIQSPGCTSPLVAPLSNGLRLSGESIAGSTTCAPNVAGVTLPTQNIGLASALASDILYSTPEAVASKYPWFFRVLPPNTTPLHAALLQQATIYSVELGGNEILNATSGLIAPGVTVVPFPFFASMYDVILDTIQATHAQVVVAGLPRTGRNLAALRRGEEIFADSAAFAALHVDVSQDCKGSQNYINVSQKTLSVVFTAAQLAAHGLPNAIYSCADIPGTADFVLTPADMAIIDNMLMQFDDHIRQQAAARGFAYFSLGTVFERPDLKPAKYSVVSQLSSQLPYGPYTSLDGVHPNGVGQALLAIAAGLAINKTYGGFGVHAVTPTVPSLAARMEEVVAPSVALERAKKFVAEHGNDRVSGCSMPGDCRLPSMARIH